MTVSVEKSASLSGGGSAATVVLSGGLELELPVAEARGYTMLMEFSELRRPLNPYFATWDTLVEQLQPRDDDQWAHVALLNQLSKDRNIATSRWISDLTKQLKRFWDEPGLLSSYRRENDGSYWEYPFSRSSEQLLEPWRMINSMICYEQERMEPRRLWRGNPRDTEAMEAFRCYTDILLRKFMNGSRVGKYVGMPPRSGGVAVTKGCIAHPRYGEGTTKESLKLAEMRTWIDDVKAEMADIINHELSWGMPPMGKKLLKEATSFYVDELVLSNVFRENYHYNREAPPSLKEYLIKRRSTLSFMDLVELTLVVREYNMEWAMAVL